MNNAGEPDYFVIVNGPEDGTEFPVVRSPLVIGSDPGATVSVRLDRGVRPKHAQISAVSNGYRVRRSEATPVWVNGKRTGALKSRIVRGGGIIQVGDTKICVQCSPAGLARRSTGIVSESDFAYFARSGLKNIFSSALSFLRTVRNTVGRVIFSGSGIFAIVVLLLIFWPGFRREVLDILWSVYSRIAQAMAG
jgi:hypothetical protein